MPGETYTVTYVADAGAFVAGVRQVEAAVRSVDQVVTASKKNLSGFAGGGGRSASSAAKNIDKLASSLGAVPNAASAAKASLNGMATAAGSVGTSTSRAGMGVGQFITASAGLSVARQAMHAVLDVTKEIEQHWQKMAEESAQFRDTLRELANIKGENGPNNNVVADQLNLGLDINAVPDEARKFAQAYENIGPTVRDKGHYKPANGQKPEELEKSIKDEAGRTAGRIGLDLEAAGEAIGSAGLFHTFTSPEQAMDVFGGAMKGLQLGKVNVTQGVRALNKASAKLVDPKEAEAEGSKPGRIQSFDDAGIYLGAMSLGLGTADQAGHRLVQNSRVLNPASETGQKALADAGVTDQMDDVQRLITMGDYFKKNKIDDVRGWMKKNEIGSDATREGIEASFKVADVLKSRIDDNRKNPAGKGTIADNEKFMATDRSASATRAKVIDQVMNQVEGERVEPLERAKSFAQSRRRLKDRDPQQYDMVSSALRATVGNVIGYLSSGVGAEGLFQEQDEKFGAIPLLKREGTKHGVDVTKDFPGIESGDYQTRAQAFKDAAAKVQKEGGDPYGEKQLKTDARGEVDAMRPGAKAAAGAPGAAGANGGAAPGKVASVDASGLDKASDKLALATDKLNNVMDRISRNFSSPGSHLGGGYDPYRA